MGFCIRFANISTFITFMGTHVWVVKSKHKEEIAETIFQHLTVPCGSPN